MTDIFDQPEVEVQPTQPPAPTFAEAPYSGNVRTRIHGYDWQLTIRAADSKTFVEKVDGLMKWLDARTDKALNVEPHAPAYVAPAAAPVPVIPGVTGATAPQTGGGTFHIAKMTVTPRADGKIDLAFFEAGHQYADIKAAKTTAEAVALLKLTGAWMPEHFAAVAEYPVNMIIDWQPSANLNKNGKPYKNIVAVKPAQ